MHPRSGADRSYPQARNVRARTCWLQTACAAPLEKHSQSIRTGWSDRPIRCRLSGTCRDTVRRSACRRLARLPRRLSSPVRAWTSTSSHRRGGICAWPASRLVRGDQRQWCRAPWRFWRQVYPSRRPISPQTRINSESFGIKREGDYIPAIYQFPPPS